MNKRRFTRVAFEANVTIYSKGVMTEGKTRDVSLRGMYLQEFLNRQSRRVR